MDSMEVMKWSQQTHCSRKRITESIEHMELSKLVDDA